MLKPARALWGAFGLSLFGLAACGGGGDEAGGIPLSCGSIAVSDGPGSGSAASHGSPQRTDGPVSVRQEGGRFIATRLVSIANDFGGAGMAQVTLNTLTGNVSSCPRAGGGYRVNVQLETRAPSEAEARQALEDMTVTHNDTLAAGLLRLSTQVSESPAGAPVGLPTVGTGSNDNIQRTAHIVAGLPSGASYDLSQDSNTGSVVSSGFSGSAASLTTNTGSVGLDGRWDRATLDSNTGSIGVSGDYADLTAGVDTGSVQADLSAVRSASISLDSNTGTVDARLQGGAAYDLTAETNTGSVSINVAGTEAVGTQTRTSQHRRSPDYGSRAVQVQLNASTNTGTVSISQ